MKRLEDESGYLTHRGNGALPDPSRPCCRTAVVATLMLWAGFPSIGQPQAIGGDWLGGFRAKSGWMALRARFGVREGALRGTIDLPSEGRMGVIAERLVADSTGVSFELDHEEERLSFIGRVDGRMIEGTVRSRIGTREFALARRVEIHPWLMDRYVGVYQLAPRRFIALMQWGSGPAFVELPIGRAGNLAVTSDTSFVAGPALAIPAPVRATIMMKHDEAGQIRGLWYREQPGGAEVFARRQQPGTEKVTFRSASVTLAGTLLLPPGVGPHPAIVTLGGGGSPEPRNIANALTFLYRGIAVLTFDKRGGHGSTGDFYTSTFSDLADDAVAAVRYLKTRAEIDRASIGLFGHSNGTIYAPLAATRSNDIAFLVLESASAVPHWQQWLHETEGPMRAAGFGDSDVNDALAYKSLMIEVGRTGERWDSLRALRSKYRDKAWFSFAGEWGSLKDLQAYYRGYVSYDPGGALAKVRVPILVTFGGMDRTVWPDVNIPVLEAAARRAGNRELTIKVFPTGNHGLVDVPTTRPGEDYNTTGYVNGYFGFLTDWILSRGRRTRR